MQTCRYTYILGNALMQQQMQQSYLILWLLHKYMRYSSEFEPITCYQTGLDDTPEY